MYASRGEGSTKKRMTFDQASQLAAGAALVVAARLALIPSAELSDNVAFPRSEESPCWSACRRKLKPTNIAWR
jgi:hypothetical protein